MKEVLHEHVRLSDEPVIVWNSPDNGGLEYKITLLSTFLRVFDTPNAPHLFCVCFVSVLLWSQQNFKAQKITLVQHATPLSCLKGNLKSFSRELFRV